MACIPGWESYDDLQKANITRFGLAISKDSPNILSEDKVNRFFCTSFVYPEEYQQRAIFGDRPYHFNISLLDIERNETPSVGGSDGQLWVYPAIKQNQRYH